MLLSVMQEQSCLEYILHAYVCLIVGVTGCNPYPGLPTEQLYTFLKEGKRMEKPEGCPDDMYVLINFACNCLACVTSLFPWSVHILVLALITSVVMFLVTFCLFLNIQTDFCLMIAIT